MSDRTGSRSEYQQPEEFLSRGEFFGMALPRAFDEGPFSLMVIRQNDWKRHSLGELPYMLPHIDHHVLRAVPKESQVCRPLIANAIAAIVRLPMRETLALARSIVDEVADDPISFPWTIEKVSVRLSGAVYDSATWQSPALLVFMTVDLSREASPGQVLPLLE